MECSITDAIAAVAREALPDDASVFLIDVIVNKKKSKSISVIVDGDKGITIGQCTAMSRQIAQAIESRNLPIEEYNLEVSSPGLNRPLKLKRQYVANIGRNLSVSLTDETTREGELLNVDRTQIHLKEAIQAKKKVQYKETIIAFNDIRQALVLPSFKKKSQAL